MGVKLEKNWIGRRGENAHKYKHTVEVDGMSQLINNCRELFLPQVMLKKTISNNLLRK